MKISRLHKKFDTISHLTGHQFTSPDDVVTRFKRGILNGESYVLKWLFGTPDADDAEYYNEAIKKAQYDEKNIQILMQGQIQIIKRTITSFNKTISNLRIINEKF